MSEFFALIWELIMEAFKTLLRAIDGSIRVVAKLANILLPFAMLFIGQYIGLERGRIAVGGELFIPVIVGIIIYFLKAYSNKKNKGVTIPLPPKDKRFTEVSDDGEVNIRHSRLQELILYMADLEDWFERKGLR